MPVLEESLPDTESGCSARILPLHHRRPLWFPILFTLHTGILHCQKRSGICWERYRGRMIRRSEVLWVQGWKEKIGGIIREERVGGRGRQRVTTRGWVWGDWEQREWGSGGELLTAWETSRCHLAWGGPKDRATQPLTQIPLLANIPCPVDLWTANNCQVPEDN